MHRSRAWLDSCSNHCSLQGLLKTGMRSSSGSAARPADHTTQKYSSKAVRRSPGSAARPANHSAEISAVYSAVLQCLDRAGWLVTPLVNGCRVAALSRACNQALEGWPCRLKCLKLRDDEVARLADWPIDWPIEGDDKVARKLQWVAHHRPKLQYLVLDTTFSNGGNLTEAIKAIAGGCSELNHLDVSTNSVSDDAIEAVAQACSDLECLSLSVCNITDAAIWAVAQGCSQLKELDVALNPVSNAAIQAIAQACPQLKRLNVTSCASLTDKAIVSVARGCHELEHLDVCYNTWITDAAIQAVAQGCPQLKALDVSECGRLADAAMQSLAGGCTHLIWLSARHCRLLTTAAVQALERGCPDLTYLDMTPLQIPLRMRGDISIVM